MLIKWNRENVLVVPVTAKTGIQTGEIQLLPGFNQVDDATWDAAKKHVAAKIKSRELEVVEKTSEDGKSTGPVAFTDLEAEDAIRVVADTNIIKTLNDWRKSEDRHDVRAAIADRIDEIRKDKKNQAGEKE